MNPAGFAAAISASLSRGQGMSDWADGYRAAARDLRYLVQQRGLTNPSLEGLLQDLERDAYVIGHEYDNKHQKRRQAAAREAVPMFPEVEPVQLLTRPTRLA